MCYGVGELRDPEPRESHRNGVTSGLVDCSWIIKL